MVRTRLAAAAIALAALAGCGHGAGAGTVPGLPALNSAPAGLLQAIEPDADRARGKIKHVIIVIQENRSLNNLFYGFPGARTVTYGYGSKNQKIPLKPVGLATTWDLAHNYQGFITSCNGVGSIVGTDCRMNGFDREPATCGGALEPKCPIKYPAYAYVPHAEITPYFDIASQYVLADEMFSSDFDTSSFVSHQYIIAATAESSVDYPDTYWGCEGGKSDHVSKLSPFRGFDGKMTVCFNEQTLGDELDRKKISWAFYASKIQPPKGGNGIWSAYQAIHHIYYGPDWKKDVFSPQTQFFSDVKNGKLRSVSWITPTCANSDHAGCNSKKGPSWVTALVNAVGKSQYWKSTAIFIFWDDSGGWYDAQPPQYKDYDGLGFRLPLLIVSSYAKKGYVDHVHYEHGSILRFVEDLFGLRPLAASDRRARPPVAAFDFTKPARAFVPIQAPYGEEFFLHQPPDPRPPDTD